MAGAAAVYDHLMQVEQLPAAGGMAMVTDGRAECRPGGCAPNIAVRLAGLGFGVQLLYPVGTDAFESGTVAQWEAAGVGCGQLETVREMPSGRAWMFAQPDGETMCFSFPGAAGAARLSQKPRLGKWLVVAPLLNPYTEAVLEEGRRQGCRLLFTGLACAGMLPFLQEACGLVVNRFEEQTLRRLMGAENASALSKKLGGVVLFRTLGAGGSEVWQNGSAVHVPACFAKAPKDVTGAGDAYTAGVLAGMCWDEGPVEAARMGAALASLAVEQKGGQTGLFTPEMMRERMNQ